MALEQEGIRLIKAFQLPVINRVLLETDLMPETDLSELFESTRQDLINKIEKILL
jgi:hypothetical protein